MHRGIFIILVLASAEAQGGTFGGYECTLDCSGHQAGYQWAESHNITDESECERILERAPNRISFYEGCMTYVEDPDHGPDPDEDENGNQEDDDAQ